MKNKKKDERSLGEQLKILRIKQRMTQEELARRCETSRTHISRIERDVSDIQLTTLIKVVRVGLGKNLKITIK